MKQPTIFPICLTIALLYTRLNLLPFVNGNILPTASGKSDHSHSQSSRIASAAVGNKDRYSSSASTSVPKFAVAASTTSAAQVSRRNDDLWYLEQSVSGPPMPYSFGYEVRDPYGNEQYRKESSDGRAVTGSYGYWGPDGIYRHVDYIADHNGYRANIRTSEPGTANENPADVTINSMPITGGVPPSTRRSYNPGTASYPPPPSSATYPSLPPAPPSPSLPLPTPRYTPPQPLVPSYNRPPVTSPVGGKTSNPKPISKTNKPAAPIDWSRKTVNQQKTDTEFRKRTSSNSDNENFPPTPISTGRTNENPVTEHTSSKKPSMDTPNLPSSPILSYDFARADKPRVRLYATGGPLPGIRSVDDAKSIQEMYELIRSELRAREKLKVVEESKEETFKSGVSYSGEVSSSPTDFSSSSHHSDPGTESEEISPVRIEHGSNERDNLRSREPTVPVSTRFMYNFPRVTSPSSISTPSISPPLSAPLSLPLVHYPERRTEFPSRTPNPSTIEPPLQPRQTFTLPPNKPDVTFHNLPENQPKSFRNTPERMDYLYKPLPETRSHLIIHSNEQKPTSHEPPALTHERLTVQEERNSTFSKYTGVPMSKRDFTISYPSSYRYASHQFMNLMPRKMDNLPQAPFRDDRNERHSQNDHPGSEIKLRATVEVKDRPSLHVPEVVVGRWINEEHSRVNGEGAYGDRVTSNIPSTDYEFKSVTHNNNPDCKDGDIMHRESTSPQTLAPETSTTKVTTEIPTASLYSLPQAAALTAPDPNEASSSSSGPDYLLDDSYEVSEGYREKDFSSSSTPSPNEETEVTITEQAPTTAANLVESKVTEEEEEEDDDDEDEDEDDLSGEGENGSSNSFEGGLMGKEKKEEPRFHEGEIRHESVSTPSNLTEFDEVGGNIVNDRSHEPMTLEHSDDNEAFIPWK